MVSEREPSPFLCLCPTLCTISGWNGAVKKYTLSMPMFGTAVDVPEVVEVVLVLDTFRGGSATLVEISYGK